MTSEQFKNSDIILSISKSRPVNGNGRIILKRNHYTINILEERRKKIEKIKQKIDN